MKTKKRIIFSSVLFILLFIVLYSARIFNSGNSDTKGKWKTGIVLRRDIGSSVLATGIIKPKIGAEVKVGSRVSGIVSRLYVKIGDSVKKGQLLGELDRTEFKAEYDEVAAALKTARTEKNYAKLALNRMKALKKKEFTSRAKLELAENAFKVSVSRVKQFEAALKKASIKLNYTRINAPISGIVASVSTQEGETVAASFTAPTFVIIIDLSQLEVQAYVDETDIGRIKNGQKAFFTVDTYPGVRFAGKITAIYPKAEMKDNVVNYISIIDIDPIKGYVLRPEMTTTVRIYQQSRSAVLTVPKIALKRERGKIYVNVLKNQQPVKRWVDTGWTDGSYIEIKKGLIQSEKIIIGKKEVN